MQRDLYVIAHDIRSAHNVGALLRLADGIGVAHVYLTGHTPYPRIDNDERLPHISEKLTKQINKTALGAIDSQPWSYQKNITSLMDKLASEGIELVALEQSSHSLTLENFIPAQRTALLLGREVEGIESQLLNRCDKTVEISMLGKKESHNVVQAAAMALFYCRFIK